MMNIAIVDDEVHCIESLMIHLHKLFPDFHIVYKSNKVAEALEQIKKMNIDLLFLDVEMPGLNGFQFLDQLPDHNFDVIFTTAYSKYAVKAFKVNAVNYLLKPIDEQELKGAVAKWRADLSEEKESRKQYHHLLEQMKNRGVLKSKLSVPVSEGYRFIEVDTIMYCRSESNYTLFFFSDGSEIKISRTLKETEQALRRFSFLRIHQSYLINPNHLKKFYRNKGGYLVMADGRQIPISQNKRRMLVDFFEEITHQ